MPLKSEDIVPINQVRARFTELAESVRSGTEKIITRNGDSYVALVDARRLDHYHQLEREHIHLQLLDQAIRGLEDVSAGRTFSVAELRARLRKKRPPRAR
ncbi:MAG: type II toxin-antitoxin system prevent-host-death family antitoxin [Myxococcota bacterium]